MGTSGHSGGDEGARTLNPCLAKAVLSQLSYVPIGEKGSTTLPRIRFEWA